MIEDYKSSVNVWPPHILAQGSTHAHTHTHTHTHTTYQPLTTPHTTTYIMNVPPSSWALGCVLSLSPASLQSLDLLPFSASGSSSGCNRLPLATEFQPDPLPSSLSLDFCFLLPPLPQPWSQCPDPELSQKIMCQLGDQPSSLIFPAC